MRGRSEPIAATTMDNVLERYDFAVYGYLATIIAAKFIAPGDDVSALLSTFATTLRTNRPRHKRRKAPGPAGVGVLPQAGFRAYHLPECAPPSTCSDSPVTFWASVR
jgi:hypothetical protein